VGGGIAPITADLVMNQLYPGKTVAELSDEQKQTVAALTTLTGTLAGGLTTGNSAGAVTAWAGGE
jgi:filamentous hemagglutinin